jgi:hypothetical protein
MKIYTGPHIKAAVTAGLQYGSEVCFKNEVKF